MWKNSFEVIVPGDFQAYSLDAPLPYAHAFHAPIYVFTSSQDYRAALIMHLGEPQDRNNGDFFSAQEKARTERMTLNGMAAWSRQDGPYEQIEVKLPSLASKECLQLYALLVFARGDAMARNIATTFRPIYPLRCFKGVS